MRNEDLSITGTESVPLDNDEDGGGTVAAAAIVTQPAVRADAMMVTPGPDGVVTLPDGVELDNIQVVGRDLVIALPDGGQMVIVDGAIFVPQLVIGTVEVPPTNLAALLIGNEPEPAGGPEVQSSGGNFAVHVPDLGPRQPLGDLLPPTERAFDLPVEEEIGRALPDDDEPDIVIISEDNPAGAKNATADVSEAGLPARNGEPAGSDSASNSETTTGTIVYQSPDSPNVVAVDGLIVNGVVITAVGQTIEGLYGTLTITSIAPGVIGFSYTLNDNTSGENTQDIFTVTITDVDGDTDSATLTIDITDDVPTARNDVGEQAGEDADITVDAFANDTPGADGVDLVTGVALVAGSLTGAGSVTYNGDGTFTYSPAPGEEGQVQFQYQITDSDGDTSTATVTIDLLPDSKPTVFVVEGSDQIVDEAGLDAGGSDAGSDEEFAEGDLDFTTGNDTLASLVINGVDVTAGGVVNGAYGTLTISLNLDGSYHYVYELTAAIDDLAGAEVDSFAIEVTDSDGDMADTTLDIEVIDDLPDANDDAAAQNPENADVDVDVFANDVAGADGVDLATGVVAVGGSLTGLGSLAYNGDGTFTYSPAPGEEGQVQFQYQITDGDGDTSTATVTIDLLPDSTPTVFVVEGSDQIVDEAGLDASGSNAGSDEEFAEGDLDFTTGNDTLASLVINGVDVTAGGVVNGAYGTLTISLNLDGSYHYVYELTAAIDDLAGAEVDSFAIEVTDSDGDMADTTLDIEVIDDLPTARDDTDSLNEGGPVSTDGNVITGDGTAGGLNGAGADTKGADGAQVSTTGVFNGTYGTLILNADGSYTYTLTQFGIDSLNALTDGETLEDSFGYTLTDGDNDSSSATLKIMLNGENDLVVINGLDGQAPEEKVDEDDLSDGSSPDAPALTQTGSFSFDSPDGVDDVTVGGTALVIDGVYQGNQTIMTQYGELTITGYVPVVDAAGNVVGGTFTYAYLLTDNTLDHGPNGEDSVFDNIPVLVTDEDGDSDDAELNIEIVDDVPAARDDTDSLNEGGPVSTDGNVITGDGTAGGLNGAGADTKGADGAQVSTTGVFNGTYGTLILNADGSYTYTLTQFGIDSLNALTDGETLEDSFGYTLTDGDNDSSSATLKIMLNGENDLVVINGLDGQAPEEKVDEDDLSDGSSPDAPALTQTGSFSFDSPDGVDDVTVGGTALVIDGVYQGNQTIMTQYGELTITGYVPVVDAAGNVVGGTFTYAYLLTDNTLDHGPNGEDSVFDNIPVLVTDEDGDSDDAELNIEIVDDVPAANDDGSVGSPFIIPEDTATNIDVFSNDVEGADGVALANITLDTQASNGTAAYNGDGTFTYTPDDGYAGPDSFTYTIKDADGDTSTATVYVDVSLDSKPQIGTPQTVTVDEDGLVGANSDDGQTDPLEINGGGLTMATGSVVVNFGADVPANEADALTLFSLLDSNALDGQLSYNGQPVTFALVGENLVGSADGDDVIIIELDGAVIAGAEVTYTYKVTLLQELDHAAGDDSEALTSLVGVGFQVQDPDTAFVAQSSFNVDVYDDVPEVTGRNVDDNSDLSLTSDADLVDSTATLSLADLFDYDALFGADGPGANAVAESYGLDVVGDVEAGAATAGIDSGLTSGGAVIYLYQVGDDVVASTAATRGVIDGTNTVFSLAVDSGTGVVTQMQFLPIDHTDDGSVSDTIQTLADGLVNGTYSVTVTDGDGDQANSTAATDLGGNIRFGDDAPLAQQGNVTVQVDEDELPDGITDGDGVDTTESGTLDALVDFGNDGPGGFSFSMAGFVDPNLTSGGDPVNWAISGGVLVGYTGADIDAPGARVIEISISETAGSFSLDVELLRQVDHPDDVANDDNQPLTFNIGGAIVASDFDGDDITLANTAVSVTVEDDIPTVSASGDDTNTAEDTETSDAAIVDSDNTMDVSNLFSFTPNYGADGQGGAPVESYGLDLVGDDEGNATRPGIDSGFTSGGATVYLYEEGGVIIASTAATFDAVLPGNTVFDLTIAGSTVTQTQYMVLDHTDDGSSTDDQLVLGDGLVNATYSVIIQDSDLDEASATATADLGGNVKFNDDAPSAVAGNVTVQVDEDELPDGITDNDGIDTTESGELNALVDFGNDGPGGFSFSMAGFVDPNLTSDGDPVNWAISGGVLVGYTGADIDAPGARVIEISISETAGSFSLDVELLRQVDHPDDVANDDNQTLTFNIGGAIVASDFDGDDITLANTAVSVTVEDDIPTVSASGDDTNTAEDTETSDADIVDNDNTMDVSNLFSFTPNYGADGQGGAPVESYGLDLVGDDEGNATRPGIDSGFTSGGATVYLYEEGGVIIASTAATFDAVLPGNTVFDLTIAGSTVTQTQYQVLDHTDDGSSTDDQLVLGDGLVNATYSVIIQDSDLDEASATATADLGGNVKFNDDAPSIVANGTTPSPVVLDETRPEGTDNDGPNGSTGDISEIVNVTSSFTVDLGNDLPGTVLYALALNGSNVASGLYALDTTDTSDTDGDPYGRGDQIVLNQTGNTITGSVGLTNYFTITIDPTTGEVTFTQLNNIWHANTASDDEAAALALAPNTLTVEATATDFDNDDSMATLDLSNSVFVIEDDGVDLGVLADLSSGNDPSETPQTGSLGLVESTDGQTFQISPDLSGLKSDGKVLVGEMTGALTYTAYQDVDGSGTVSPGDLEVFTITIDPSAGASGEYEFDLIRPLDGDLVPVPIGGSNKDAGGPVDSVTLFDGNPKNGPVDDLAVVSGFYWTPSNADLAAWKAGTDADTLAGGLTNGQVNGSLGGWGVQNNNFTNGEFFNWDFGPEALDDPDGPGGMSPPGGTTLPAVSTFEFGFANYGAGDIIHYVVHFTDGSTAASGQFDVDLLPQNGSGDGVWFFDGGGKEIADVEMYSTTSGSGKVYLISVGTTAEDVDVDIPVTVTVTDGDGDGESDDFVINVNDSAPMVLPSAAGGEGIVYENDLPGGSDTTPESTTIVGNFQLNAADGVADLSVGGVSVISGGNFLGGSIVTPLGNTLTITSFDANTGMISYEYTLVSAKAHGGSDILNDTVGISLTDTDGDFDNAELTIQVVDDAPAAANDVAVTSEATGDINAAFVLDFSGSINNTELNQMLQAVESAVTEMYNGTGGDVTVTLVAFSHGSPSSGALNYGPFTSLADVISQLDALNPAEGGSRPYSGRTNFTAAIEELMANYTPDASAQNDVYFLSDGNPNEGRGSGGYTLSNSAKAAWQNFVDANDIDVTSIGIGNNINDSHLQNIDVDGTGVPLRADTFADLVDTLLDAIRPDEIMGDILANDAMGADGGRIASVTIEGVTYDWDGAGTITPDNGGAAIAGSILNVTTAIGGDLTIDLANGQWTYQAPTIVAATTSEIVSYVLVDNDGSLSSASLTITVADATVSSASLASYQKTSLDNGGVNSSANDNQQFQQSSFTQSLMMGAAIAVAFGSEHANVHPMMKTGLADFEQGTISFAMPQADYSSTIGAEGQGFGLDMPSIGSSVMTGPAVGPAIESREAIDHGGLQGNDMAPVIAAPAIDALPSDGLGDAAAPMAMMATDIVMPGAQALAIMAKESAGLTEMPAEAVGTTIAEALAGGDANPIDGILAVLGGGGSVISEMAMIPNVPLWDSGLFGGFTQSAPDIMVMEAMVLHHDAITPAVNG